MSCDVYENFVWTINVLQIYDISFNIMVVTHAHTFLIWEEWTHDSITNNEKPFIY